MASPPEPQGYREAIYTGILGPQLQVTEGSFWELPRLCQWGTVALNLQYGEFGSVAVILMLFYGNLKILPRCFGFTYTHLLHRVRKRI